MSTAEDYALTRLTTARPHELAAAIGPHLSAAASAELVGGTPYLSVVPDVGPRPAVRVDAALWLEVGALIPEVARRRRQPGRRRRDDRHVLEGILHVLATGIGWRELPQELGCGSGVTCWRRLREWVDTGTWAIVEPRLRDALGPGATIDWDRPWVGSSRSREDVRAAPLERTVVGDPGATDDAVVRRRAWSGPSLL